MAKKKHKRNSRSARRQAPAAPITAAPMPPIATPAQAAAEEPKPAAVQSTASTKNTISGERWSYVGKDVAKIGGLLAFCIVLELVVWYLLADTSLGPTVYHLINV